MDTMNQQHRKTWEWTFQDCFETLLLILLILLQNLSSLKYKCVPKQNSVSKRISQQDTD